MARKQVLDVLQCKLTLEWSPFCMSSLPDHPGYLGLSSRGVMAIHADWPAYPIEHGWAVALEALGQFSSGSVLIQVDEIDKCFLFVLRNDGVLESPFDPRHLHVAVWREDLHELHARGFVSGTYLVSLQEWIDERRTKHDGLFFKDSKGKAHPVPLPTMDDFDVGAESEVLMVRDAGISLTGEGLAELDRYLSTQRGVLHPSIGIHVAPILAAQLFDTAVREGCLLIEVRLREISGTSLYGQPLVAECGRQFRSSGKFMPSQLKAVSLDLRTAFKFVRNPYMHGFHEMTSIQCYSLLARLSRVLMMLDQVQAILAPSADSAPDL